MALSVGVLSFAAVPFSGPLWDHRFIAFERTLGIDWPALAAWMSDSPLGNRVLAVAYNSAFAQMLCVMFLLPGLGRAERLGAYLKALAFTLALAGLFPILCPAVGPITAYGIPEGLRAHLGTMGVRQLGQFFALRDGTLRTFDLAHMEGLVTFPSFHTTVAILAIWALRPVRLLGKAALAVNLLLIAATIPRGGHYIADILGGAVLAFAALALFAWRPWRGQTWGLSAWKWSGGPAPAPILEPAPAASAPVR
jgi:hypothetical protein